MLIIVIGNIVVYMMDLFSNGAFSAMLYFEPFYLFRGQIWRLITFVFVPMGSSSPFFFILSLYFYWWIGSTLEREWGTTKFTVYYAMGVILNILYGIITYLLPFMGSGVVTMDYVNLSLFFAFATLYPDMRVIPIIFLPFFSVKIKWLAWIDAALFAFSMISSFLRLDIAGGLLPVIAILNYLLFFWSDLTGFVRRTTQRAKYQSSRQTINFKSATRKAQQEKGYIHKCAVCGKTDTDYPDEEFRYCSQCNGYYCYCSEHIHNHVHIN
ncbi:MAG TPA: rhomboid family intramembrane serine protease [Candidatus Galloscillospira excrementavium]|nr:rhomboid family intramembrane serine protease [Candidatus Galloscillospira excrementavium]